jgi:hypothetical protein
MKEFTIASPDTCALVVKPGGLVYVSTVGAITYTSDDATFETFPTPEAAATRAKELDPTFDTDYEIFGISKPEGEPSPETTS